MHNYWKIIRIPYDEDLSTWDTTASTILTDYYDPMFSDKIGDGKDSFSFKLTNYYDTYDNYFKIADKLLIYQKANSSDFIDSDLLCTGIVKALPETETGTANLLRVEGANFSEVLMNAIAFTDGKGVPINTFLQNALASVNAYNKTYQITWHPDNPTTKQDGITAFPAVQEQWFNKSMNTLMEKYSQSTYTEDGNYYFYVDSINRLVWRPMTTNSSGSFDDSVDTYESINIKRDLSGVVNFVIVKGGRSPGGRILSNRAFDPVSAGKNGFKYKLIISGKSYDETVGLDQKKHGNTESEFPPDADLAAGYETAWICSADSSDAPACTKGQTVKNITSKDLYDKAVFREVKIRLKAEGDAYINLYKYGKRTVDLEFTPLKKWGLGTIINMTIAKIGVSNYPMRVESRQFTNTTNKYTLIEDEGSI